MLSLTVKIATESFIASRLITWLTNHLALSVSLLTAATCPFIYCRIQCTKTKSGNWKIKLKIKFTQVSLSSLSLLTLACNVRHSHHCLSLAQGRLSADKGVDMPCKPFLTLLLYWKGTQKQKRTSQMQWPTLACWFFSLFHNPTFPNV